MPDFDLFVIGGSAGALEPLIEIVGSLPADFAIPIAVVLHQTPTQPSLVPTLLARSSDRRIREPEDKEPLLPHTVYVAPPNYHMLVERSGTIALSVDDLVNFSRPSIDVLFESAVDAFGARVVGLVLSGANADGSAGLRRIADAGGIALVQSVASAAVAAMPAAAAQLVPAARTITPRDVGSVLARLSAAPSLAEPLS